jgi:hypothetical protein
VLFTSAKKEFFQIDNLRPPGRVPTHILLLEFRVLKAVWLWIPLFLDMTLRHLIIRSRRLRALLSFETAVTAYPVAWRHTPKERKPYTLFIVEYNDHWQKDTTIAQAFLENRMAIHLVG